MQGIKQKAAAASQSRRAAPNVTITWSYHRYAAVQAPGSSTNKRLAQASSITVRVLLIRLGAKQ